MRTPGRGALLVAVTTVVAGFAAAQPASAAWESDYGSRTTMTVGPASHAQLPVALDLPAPASGGALTSVTVRWTEQIPQQLPGSSGSTTAVTRSLDTSACTTDATCHVETVIPTTRIANGTPSLSFTVANGEGSVAFFSRRVTVDNPKPTVAFTAPDAGAALWGDATVAADAAASDVPDAAPLEGVRFYLDGTLGAGSAYVFDDTAPYAVTVPATDIAPVLGSRYIVAVAQDADGNLSQMPASGSTTAMRRLVTVGPPPLVSWTTATDPGRASGSVAAGVYLDFHAALPDSAPAAPGKPYDPYLRSIEVLLDGVSTGVTSWTDPASWNNYAGNTKLRTIDGGRSLDRDHGLTGGRHTVTLRVTTSYGSVEQATTGILVADGVTWTGPVTSGGRRVEDGFVVTAGTLRRFQVPVATRVAGTHVFWADMQVGDQGLLPGGVLCPDDPATCPESTVLHSAVWGVPDEPGTRTLTISVRADGDPADETLTRQIVVQPAARLTLDVSRHVVRPGTAVGLSGRLTRRDTGRPQAGRVVSIQWSPLDRIAWRTVTTRTTDTDGLVHARLRPVGTGIYRLRTDEIRGTIGAGTSPEQRVELSR